MKDRTVKFVVTRKEMTLCDGESGQEFYVVLTFDEEFGTWSAKASVGSSESDTQEGAVFGLKSTLERLVSVLGEIEESAEPSSRVAKAGAP